MTLRDERFVFELTGGALCLDFANTVDYRPSERRKDHLENYGDLIAWGRQAGALPPSQARLLLREAARDEKAAAAALHRARELREAVYRVFSAVAASRAAREADVAVLNAAVAGAFQNLRLAPAAGGYAWTWGGEPDLDRVLWPVVRSAAELLTCPELTCVRECAAEECGWLFLDRSKNRTRRWCDMKVCGNRNKVRRFHERKRAGL